MNLFVKLGEATTNTLMTDYITLILHIQGSTPGS